MVLTLPGQNVESSDRLRRLLAQAEKECRRPIKFESAVGKDTGEFLGQIEWRAEDNDIVIQVPRGISLQFAEYLAGHELGHALQYARGYAIAVGKASEPIYVSVATAVSDLVFDAMADSLAIEFGLPMAAGFDEFLRLDGYASLLEKLRRLDGRRYGSNWTRVWTCWDEALYARVMRLKPPRQPRELQSLIDIIDWANLVRRSTNLGLSYGDEIRRHIRKVPLVTKTVDDLLSMTDPANGPDESLVHLINILVYFKATQNHIIVDRPVTGEVYIDNRWQLPIEGMKLPRTPFFSISETLE